MLRRIAKYNVRGMSIAAATLLMAVAVCGLAGCGGGANVAIPTTYTINWIFINHSADGTVSLRGSDDSSPAISVVRQPIPNGGTAAGTTVHAFTTNTTDIHADLLNAAGVVVTTTHLNGEDVSLGGTSYVTVAWDGNTLDIIGHTG